MIGRGSECRGHSWYPASLSLVCVTPVTRGLSLPRHPALPWMFYHDANETVETGQWRPPLISAAPGVWTWAPVPASVGQTNTVKYPVIIFTYSIQRWWLGRLRLIYAIQEIYRRGRHNQTVEFIFRSEAAGWLVLSSVILGLGKRWNGRGDQTCPRTLINEI